MVALPPDTCPPSHVPTPAAGKLLRLDAADGVADVAAAGMLQLDNTSLQSEHGMLALSFDDVG